jgi:hypothetical protein
MKKILLLFLDLLIYGPFVNGLKERNPLISERAIKIANKIGWNKMMEKAKEAQQNGTSTINLKEYE